MSFSFDVITKLLNMICSSIELQWVLNLAVSELAINTPTRGNVLVNTLAVRLIRIKIRRLNWFKNLFEIHVHDKWNLKLGLSITEFNCQSHTRHLNSNSFVVLTVSLMLISAQLSHKSLQAGSAEMLFTLSIRITARKQSAKVLIAV